jgi:hypothetical protein
MSDLEILRKGLAERVVFFYPGEEGTFLTTAKVTLYANGILHAKNDQEEITTHISNVEVVWKTLDKNKGKQIDKNSTSSHRPQMPSGAQVSEREGISGSDDEPQLGQLIPLNQFQTDKPL